MGLMLSRLIGFVLGFKNGTSLVMTAFGGTAAVFFTMASLATVIKRDLSSMGKFLVVGAVILMVAGIANIFLQSSTLMLTMLVMSLAIFSAFMLYDIKRVVDGGETNYISPRWPSIWMSTTCSRACCRCSGFLAAIANKPDMAGKTERPEGLGIRLTC